MAEIRTRAGAADIAVCIAIILLAASLLLFGRRSEGGYAVVSTADGEYSYRLDRNMTKNIVSGNHNLTLEIKDGAVRIKDSDCPDKLCVASGWTRDPSKLIVCAPAKVLVRISSKGGDCSDADFIAGR